MGLLHLVAQSEHIGGPFGVLDPTPSGLNAL